MFSPDGKTIAFAGQLTDRWNEDTHVFVVPADGSAGPELVAPDLDRPTVLFPNLPAPVCWTADRELLMLVNDRGSVTLHRARLGDRRSREVVGGDLIIDGVAARPGRRAVAFTATWPDRPSEVLVTTTAGAEPIPLTSACTGDWGGGDCDDILACCDDLIERGVVDGGRMFVSGGSYGGFMTSWLVGRTDRFRAAAAVAAVVDQTSMALTTEISEFSVFNVGGTPWTTPDEYERRSPLSYLPAVRTPVLVIHWRETSGCRSARGRSSTPACACSANGPSSCAIQGASTSSALRPRRSTSRGGFSPGTSNMTLAGKSGRATDTALRLGP